MQQSFNAYIENSIREHWELVALSDFKGVSYQYKDIARKIEKLHILMNATGIQRRQNRNMWTKFVALGSRFFRHIGIRCSSCTHTS